MDYEIWVGGLAPDVDNKNFCEFLQQLDVKPTKVCLTVKMFEKNHKCARRWQLCVGRSVLFVFSLADPVNAATALRHGRTVRFEGRVR